MNGALCHDENLPSENLMACANSSACAEKPMKPGCKTMFDSAFNFRRYLFIGQQFTQITQ